MQQRLQEKTLQYDLKAKDILTPEQISRERLLTHLQLKIENAIQDSLTLKQWIEIALENNPGIGYKSWKIKEVDIKRRYNK